MPTLTRSERAMLQRIATATQVGKCLLASLIIDQGRTETTKLRKILAADLAEMVDHHAVRDTATGLPAVGIRITQAGLERLAEQKVATP